MNNNDLIFKDLIYRVFYEPYYLKEILSFNKYGKIIEKEFENLLNKTISSNEQLSEYIINYYFQDKKKIDKNLKKTSLNLKTSITKSIYSSYINDINKFIIGNNLEQFADFILFGSLATDDFVKEFSDIDMVCFIKDSVFESPYSFNFFQEKMYQLNGLLLRIDPLQNHGVFIVLPYEKLNYKESLNIPLEVLTKGILLGSKKKTIELLVNNDSSFQDSKKYLSDYIKLVQKEMLNANNSYRFYRDFLHRVYLLPALYLQDKGRYCYKKDSFSLINNYNGFDVISKLCNFYDDKFYKSRIYRKIIPSFLFKRYPIVMRYLLSKIYGSKEQKILSNSELKSYFEKLNKLIKKIENE
ncbi:nucleotidyltransferase domain-containing protein [Poseidonibacter lekithochrous]|uniref:nucleotidyltransferase domain-containing protein n=1 Tax=Poseidonibacter lekithochrous TaxID=1904463 RepID=UPI0008FC63AE|nr:nucleotidyltransferase domain-containing protein [Poseidonibacter lekithochrous]QKJ22272.1 hypothetical protein ALEK_0991 [Poseidonibacter lekithochrous]